MDNCSKRYFRVRPSTDAHSKYLKTVLPDTRGSISNLLWDVFVRHRAVFSQPTLAIATAEQRGADGYPSTKTISAELYKLLCASQEGVQKKGGDSEEYNLLDSAFALRTDKSGAIIPIRHFLDQILNFDASPDRNRIFVLTGEVGCGKSTFINSFISTSLSYRFAKEKFWFVRTNIEVANKDTPLTLDRLYEIIAEKVEKKLEELFHLLSPNAEYKKMLAEAQAYLEQALEHDPSVPDSQTTRYMARKRGRALGRAIEAITRVLGRRLLLIIDNLDYVFHTVDRGLYANSKDTGEFEAVRILKDLIRELNSRQAEMGSIGANVLIILRHENFENFVSDPANISSFELPPYQDYYLEYPNLADVVESRTRLLSKALTMIMPEGKRREEEKRFLTMVKQLEDEVGRLRGQQEHRQTVTYFIRSAARAGLRDLMDHMETYSWIRASPTEEEPLDRISQHFTLGQIVYMLGGRRRYSQTYSAFPNIFLVNADKAEVAKMFGEENHPTDHPHTYWLKYLILSYLNHVTHANLDDVLSVFGSAESTSSKKGYANWLVRLSLGSMSQVGVSALVKAKRTIRADRSTVTIDNIHPTNRAKFCLENVFWKLPYLQLIVEDYLLPIPVGLRTQFEFPIDDVQQPDYRYLLEPRRSYAEAADKMFQIRSRQVVQFFAVLETTYKMEEDAYSDVFGRLRDIGMSAPNFAQIRQDLFKEIALVRSYRTKLAPSPEADEAEYERAKENIKSSVSEFYEKCFEGGR